MKTENPIKTLLSALISPNFWRVLRDHIGFGKQKKVDTITSQATLAYFVNTRSSHVAQTSLYGYLRTRAGTRFPELFKNPDILQSINMAKWHIWLACVSDLCVFVGRLLYQSGQLDSPDITALMSGAIDQILQETGHPEEAGEVFHQAIDKAGQRIHNCDWSKNFDEDEIFSQSPAALFYWAPIADELKDRDELIVRNSVRFRWIEVRRSARALIDIDSLANAASTTQAVEVNAG
ncbi:MAG: esterase [Gammaproteobacteria bacterium]